MPKSQEEWKFRWKNWVRETQITGLYELRDGGYLYRRMVTDPTTGKKREAKKVMPGADEITATIAMQEAIQKIRDGAGTLRIPKKRFAVCAMEVFEDKQEDADFKSDATINRWKDTLVHLIAGSPPPPSEDRKRRPTKSERMAEQAGLKVAGLGEVYIHMLDEPLKQWRKGVVKLIEAGAYAPSTANSWVSILQVVTKAIAEKHKLPRDPGAGFKKFDESEHPTYTEEDPNAVPPDRVGEFIGLVFEHFPQHYAMTFTGFVTGLRPSSLRPLRRRGPESDIKWDTGKLLIRQSQTIGKHIMKKTKQGTHQSITLPAEVIEVLQWHVETQLRTPEQRQSDLLFPSETGGFRARSVLDKPFQAVSKMMDLGFDVTPRAMRRTFQDIQRLADIKPLVTRSISGHATERMQAHYSTIQGAEQRKGLAQVIQLYGPSNVPGGAAQQSEQSEHTERCAPDSPEGAVGRASEP